MNKLLQLPSFYGQIISGSLILFAIIYIFVNFNYLRKFNVYESIFVLLAFSIAVGIHTLCHIGMESVYGYNPLINIFY